MSDIGQRIKQKRESLGISQYRLSRLSGISQATISAIEADGQTRSPAVDTAMRLAEALGTSLAELTGDMINNNLTAREKKLITDFRALNPDGQNYIMQQIAIAQKIYVKSDTVPDVANHAG